MRSTSADPSCRVRVWKYRKQRFYAERGLIHVADEHSGDYRKIGIREFMHRAKAYQALQLRTEYKDERAELQRMIEGMVECARLAKSQGSPFATRDRQYISRHASHPRILVPGTAYNVQRVGGKVALIADGR